MKLQDFERSNPQTVSKLRLRNSLPLFYWLGDKSKKEKTKQPSRCYLVIAIKFTLPDGHKIYTVISQAVSVLWKHCHFSSCFCAFASGGGWKHIVPFTFQLKRKISAVFMEIALSCFQFKQIICMKQGSNKPVPSTQEGKVMPSQRTCGAQFALGSLFYRHLLCGSCTSPQSGGQDWMCFVLSNPKQSTIPWFWAPSRSIPVIHQNELPIWEDFLGSKEEQLQWAHQGHGFGRDGSCSNLQVKEENYS